MEKRTKKWILIFAAAVLVCLALFILFRRGHEGTIAVISIDGEVYREIDLSLVTESYDIEIDTQYGHNTVHVEPGAISVSSADCPDGICVKQGRITTGGIPLVCMPHRLVIQIKGSDIDA